MAMTTKEQEGYDLAKGAARFVSNALLIGIVIMALFNLTSNWCGWGIDDSDKDGWNRSGLAVHTDFKTGLQYFSDGKGGLCLRVSDDGSPVRVFSR